MFWRRKREHDLDRELRDHLNLEAQEQPDAYAARRALGNTALIKEDVRETWGWMWLDRLWQDARYAVRALRKSPAFALTATLSLALGIGANTAIFTVVNAVLLKPLPFFQPQRLVQLWENKPAQGYFRNVVNGVNFLEWREHTHSFEDMAAVSVFPANLTGLGDPIALDGIAVSPQYFAVLGASPALGRSFTAEDGRPGHGDVAILSFGLWQARFGGDRAVLGRKITLNGSPAIIVGVMPRGFALPQSTPDIWMPLFIDRSPNWQLGRSLTVVARLKPDVTRKQAESDLQSAAAQLSRERPDYDAGWSAEVAPMLQDATRNVRLPLLVLFAAAGIVLLIACANVANLLLMRSSGRSREIAVRAALGAGRRRLLQQLLAESLVLALAACAAGCAAAYWGVKAVLAIIPAQNRIPRMEAIHIDSSVLLFALALSFVTAIIFGLIPALHVSQVHPHQVLRQGAIRASKNSLRQGLVVAEIALSLILLAGAGLMLRSFHRLISVDPGFETQRILTLRMFASPAKYLQPRGRATYFARVLDEIRMVPGVREAGSVLWLPLQEDDSGSCFDLAEKGPPTPSVSPDANILVVSPGYFQAMGTPLRGGRHFDARDTFDSTSVIMVNQEFVRRFLPDRDAVGQKLNVCWGREFRNPGEIVGVVADARQDDLQTPPRATIFIDNLQSPMFFAQIAIRASGDPLQIAHSVQAAIHRVDPDQAITHVKTMEQVFSDSVAQPRLQLALLGIFGALAGLLAAIGIYGVAAYSAAQRTREIGIRMALGARPGDVRRLVLREGLVLGAAGVVAGLAGALGLTRVLKSLLFETTPTDAPTLALAVIAVLGVTLLATLIPARRASRIDPMATLRGD
ncbi:MAG TPA: ABC transporter permease [Bryobacteraceae bacterium]